MNILKFLIVGVVITSGTITFPPVAYWAVFGPIDTSTDVLCNVTPPSVTTGPYTFRVSTDPASDCYQADGVFPNGTLINERWSACPQ